MEPAISNFISHSQASDSHALSAVNVSTNFHISPQGETESHQLKQAIEKKSLIEKDWEIERDQTGVIDFEEIFSR